MDIQLKNQLEALLFASGRKLTLEEIMKLTGVYQRDLIQETLHLLKQEFDARNSAMMLVEETDGWKLTTREHYLPLVQKIVPHTELSKSVLETLAVIAWKQPILQSEVIRIRTNKAYEHITELELMGFVTKKKFGRSFSLSLTQKFLEYFDFKDSAAAKAIFKDIKEELMKEGETTAEKVQPLPAESVGVDGTVTQEPTASAPQELPEDEKDEDVYDAKDELLDEDELTPDEEKFMEGYEKAAPELQSNQKHAPEKSQKKSSQKSEETEESE